jgi:hypothetical protein
LQSGARHSSREAKKTSICRLFRRISHSVKSYRRVLYSDNNLEPIMPPNSASPPAAGQHRGSTICLKRRIRLDARTSIGPGGRQIRKKGRSDRAAALKCNPREQKRRNALSLFVVVSAAGRRARAVAARMSP